MDGAVEEDEGPFLLLLSGLGGGSQDTYVRAQAAAAVERGWKVGVLNMRSCGGSPVTSPRFFSARHGSVEDVRTATTWIRTNIQPTSLAAIGWSNSGTIVCNALSEPDSLINAACCLAAPLSRRRRRGASRREVTEGSLESRDGKSTQLVPLTARSWLAPPPGPTGGEL